MVRRQNLTVETKHENFCRVFFLFYTFLVIFFMIGSHKGWALDPNVSVDKYIPQHWGIREGLPHNTVNAIVEDRSGYIWLGTDNGLARFDGNTFIIFNTSNTPTLKNNSITCLLLASDYRLWIGTKRGIVIYSPITRKFSGVYNWKNAPSDFITSMAEDYRKMIWVGTRCGLGCFNGMNFTSYFTDDGLSSNKINAVVTDSSGVVWIGTENGLNLFSKGEFSIYKVKNGLPDNRIRCMSQAKDGEILIGTSSGMCRIERDIEKGTVTFLPSSFLNPSGRSGIYSVMPDWEGTIWISTENGIKRFIAIEEKDSIRYRAETLSNIDGIPINTPINRFFLDKKGGMWFATTGKGLVRLHNTSFTYYSSSNGLLDTYSTCVYEDEKKGLWIGTRNGGLNHFHGKTQEVFTRSDGLNSNHIIAVSHDRNGRLWVGTSNGLNYFSSTGFMKSPLPNSETGSAITFLFRDKKGNLWVGSETGGVNILRGGQFYPIKPGEIELDFNRIVPQCITQDISERIWLGTNKGLYCIKENKIVKFYGQERFASRNIQDIFPDYGGILWIGTESGMVFFDTENGDILYASGESEFATASIYQLFDDQKDNLWMSSNKGIFSVSKSIYRSWRMKDSQTQYYHLTESDGLKTSIFTEGCQAGWKSSNGAILFASIDGVVKLDPLKLELPGNNIPVHVEQVFADDTEYKIGTVGSDSSLIFPSDVRKVEFYLSALNFNGIENLKFRCTLSGDVNTRFFNSTTVVDHRMKKATFLQLPSGHYNLKINAGNEDKGWSQPGIELFFSVGGGISWVEITLLILIIVLAVSMVVFFRIRDHRKKAMEMMSIFQDDARYKTSAMDHDKIKKYMLQILTLMEKEKLYLDPEMSVLKMGQRLGIPKEYISQVINQKFYMNFNQFLNKYRVEEAKIRLKDPKENQFVVLKIGFDVGFNSKSAFNGAFKKFTGMSPSEYREKYQGQEPEPKKKNESK